MESNTAADHLQVIRTLMERSAIYRRALAPIMLTTGFIGAVAALAGWLGGISSLRSFALYWMVVSLVALSTSLLLVRRQAIKDAEKFWSPPTRRVAQGFLPPLFVGMIIGLASVVRPELDFVPPWSLPVLWMFLYGCALQAAGFFMARGIRLFGSVFVGAGCAVLTWCLITDAPPSLVMNHLVMGLGFGGLHLAYGIYLRFTEQSKRPV
jgi:hypothetical protein